MSSILGTYIKTSKHGQQLRFVHTGYAPYRKENFQGYVTNMAYLGDTPVWMTISPNKLRSKGWKLVPNAMLSLEEEMLADITSLNNMANSGTHVIQIGEVAKMIGRYAIILQESKL